MIRLRTSPASGGLVATLATGCGRNMGCRLAGRDGAVVAVRAAGGDRHIGMELGRQPARWCVLVAACAIGTGADVIRILACCFAAIVTAGAQGC